MVPGPPKQEATEGTAETGLEQTRLKEPSSAPPGKEDPWLGKVIAERYKVVSKIGAGGMGAVYRAQHVHMKKVFALKVLHPRMNVVPEAVARFEREAVAVGRIEHPNVAQATDFGRLGDGGFYMAMEFVEGQTLRRRLKTGGALEEHEAAAVAEQVALALEAAHAQGVVHRDLKPDNIMLTGDTAGTVKVLDFGIAKLNDDASEGTALTQVGSVFGTPDYMSPEQAGGQAVDARSDLYALGLILHEMLTGTRAFSGPSIGVVLAKQMQAPPPALPLSIHPALAKLVARLLEKEPERRLQTASKILEALRRIELSPSTEPSHPNARSAAQRTGLLAAHWLVLARKGFQRSVKALDAAPWPGLLAQRLDLGAVTLRLGTVLSLALALAASVAVLASSSGGTRSTTEAGPPETKDRNDDPSPPPTGHQLVGDAPVSDELGRLLALPVYKRTYDDWTRLGALYREGGDWPGSTSAYRNAVQLDRRAAKDGKLLQAFRDAAVQKKSYEAALNVAVNLLGEPGMDLVFDVWVSTREKRKLRFIADKAHQHLKIARRSRSSKALAVRLNLQFAKPDQCELVASAVHEAIEHADARSVGHLQALTKTSGCGDKQQADCWPCLGDRADLEAALETAKQQPAPRFDGKRYIPAP